MRKKESTERHANWAFDVIKDICDKFQAHQSFMEVVVENLPGWFATQTWAKFSREAKSLYPTIQIIANSISDLIRCMKPYPDTHTEIFQVVVPFLKQCSTKKYGQRICEKTITSIQYFARVITHGWNISWF